MSNHVIVDNATHRALRVLPGHDATLGDAVMACLTVPTEFRQVQASFPIVFRRDIDTRKFAAFVLFGFETGENLYLDGDRWDAPYKPLALAIQPFLIGRGDAAEEAQVHIDMTHPRVTGGATMGVRLFDDAGQPSPYLEEVAEKLGDLDAGYRASEAFHSALERHDLLEPFTLDVPLRDGSRNSLVGFHTIDEARLAALDGAALGDLHRDGHLVPLMMAVASLAQLGGFVARKNTRVGGG